MMPNERKPGRALCIAALGCALVFSLAWLVACIYEAARPIPALVVPPPASHPPSGEVNPPLPSATQPSPIVADPYTLTGRCTRDECLLARDADQAGLVGIARVRGYYGPITNTQTTGEVKTCDTLTVVSGPTVLIERYLALVDSGNTINSKNGAGQLVIKLSLGALPPADRTAIMSSDMRSPVSVLLMPLPTGSRGEEACYSPVEVLRADAAPPAGLTATFSSTELGITLQYPAAWQPGSLGDHLYGGDDGFFSVSAAAFVEPSAASMCESELQVNLNKENLYGQHPLLENLLVDGQPACLITPSDDQPALQRGSAFLAVAYPDAAARLRAKQAVIVSLFADKQHIRDLARTFQFTGPLLQPMLDPSTPAPPAADVKHFASDYGVSFDYPANWFTFLKEAENVVVVLNAPPDGIYALKQGGDFRAIAVGLKPADIAGYESVRAYMQATFLQQCFECKVLAVEALPPLKQGYAVMRVTYLGEGERAVLFVTNGQHLIELSTTYAPGKRSEARYLEVLDQIVGSLVIP